MLSKILAVLIYGLLATVAQAQNQNQLSEQIPYPLHAVHSASQNHVRYVDDGIEALQIRIDMIRRAKKTIETEYFIYNLDTGGKIISKELIAAARRGVKVRLLIDKSQPIFVFTEPYVGVMKQFGIDVRYYNTAPLWKLSSIQFRNHRKLLAIDDLESITGGRNIADEYFDMHHEFNFNDADLYVYGPMSKVMRESFDLFFEHDITDLPKQAIAYPPEVAEYFYASNQAEADAIKRVDQHRKKGFQYKLHTCPVLTFSSDAPGANFFKRIKPGFSDRYRYFRRTLVDKVSAVDRKLIIASPYIIENDNAEDILDRVLANGAQVELYTNSLGSTDAVYVAANMYLDVGDWLKKGAKVVLHDGKWIPKNQDVPQFVRQANSGLHSKVHIYETSRGSEVMVGTYNIDNRSDFYNAEMGLFCAGNEAFTQEVKQTLTRDEYYGLKMSADARSAIDFQDKVVSIYGAEPEKVSKMKKLTWLYWLARDLL